VGSLPQATGGSLLYRGSPRTTGEQPASPWSSAQVAREGSPLWHFAHLLPSPSSLTLVSAELFLSHSLTLLSSLPSHHSFFFSSPSEICYHKGATTIADWLGLGQWWVHLRASWH